LKRGILIMGGLLALTGGGGRLVLFLRGEPFMEGRLYALFVSGLVVVLLGLSYEMVFGPDGDSGPAGDSGSDENLGGEGRKDSAR
jgi:hypothetical protein